MSGLAPDEDVRTILKKPETGPTGQIDRVFLYAGRDDLRRPSERESFETAVKQKPIAGFNAGEPGYGASACEYPASRKIILRGSGTWSSEAVGPGFGGENTQSFECHITMMTERGIWNIENFEGSRPLAHRAYEFLFVFPPLRMKGTTGSPGNPAALLLILAGMRAEKGCGTAGSGICAEFAEVPQPELGDRDEPTVCLCDRRHDQPVMASAS